MGDRDGKVEPLSIAFVPGKLAPRFDAHTTELTPLNVTITEQGMKSGLAMVDFVFEDPRWSTSSSKTRTAGASSSRLRAG
jgi:hypothetical protein